MLVVLCGFTLGAAAVWWSVAGMGTLLAAAAAQMVAATLAVFTQAVAATALDPERAAVAVLVLSVVTPALLAALLLALGRAQGIVRPLAGVALLAIVVMGVARDGVTAGTVSLAGIGLLLALLVAFASRFLGFVLAVLAGALAASGLRSALDRDPSGLANALDTLTGASWGVVGVLAALAVCVLPYVAVCAALVRSR